MFRTFMIAATLSLTAAAAQADDGLAARVHEAAVKACAAKVGGTLPITFYGALSASCADRVSTTALASIHAKQMAQISAAAN